MLQNQIYQSTINVTAFSPGKMSWVLLGPLSRNSRPSTEVFLTFLRFFVSWLTFCYEVSTQFPSAVKVKSGFRNPSSCISFTLSRDIAFTSLILYEEQIAKGVTRRCCIHAREAQVNTVVECPRAICDFHLLSGTDICFLKMSY